MGTERFPPGQHVQVIDPEDGYYLDEGDVEEVRAGYIFVRFAFDPDLQRFRPGQLRQAVQEEEQ
jgi:hypothetical protein